LIFPPYLDSSSFKKNLDTWFFGKMKISKFFHGFSFNPLMGSVLYVVGVKAGSVNTRKQLVGQVKLFTIQLPLQGEDKRNAL